MPKWFGYSVWCLYLTWLGLKIWQYVNYASYAISFPYEIDYGEGIVWQQAELIFGPRAYGDILQFPYIVFHYPPVYHALLRAVSGLGFDTVTAGRGLSAVSGCTVAVFVGYLTMLGAPGAWHGRMLAAAVSGLVLFTFGPMVFWSLTMRVDLLALAFSLGGAACVAASFRRPSLVYLGMVLFVLAIFTKQTSISAPVAALIVVMIRTPSRGFKAALLGIVLGGAALITLQVLTEGGFLKHIVTYNLNRFDLVQTVDRLLGMLGGCAIYSGLAMLALTARWRLLRPEWRGLAGLVQLVRRDDLAAWSVLMAAYLILCTVTLITSGKSGAASNYFLEWSAVVCIWLGARVSEPVSVQQSICGRIAATILIPLALLMQGAIQPQWALQLRRELMDSNQLRDRAAMLEFVKHTSGPVLSDDMVLLLRAGKQVPLEPAIFAELAAMGRWPENLLLRLLNDRVFGAVITKGGPEDPLFNSRFLPASRDAIVHNYIQVGNYDGYLVWTRR